ncbi:hypothetical protein A1O1_04258 [Capronia coronata CBS 617.96]|uniref:GAT domain-containing protein n=1 Tax=Capronia coronata CBS 617.96 TaxID=1182541 RepID=W9Z9F8_9EURO|nr:uncharacterized protein A1O1_04258 [Capronia coronata CBS 617.96]EXJ91149.1 hypothetical protein A1O1_04258 [Capronia coronata CBS 617.96]
MPLYMIAYKQADDNVGPDRNATTPVVLPQGDSPEAVIVREVTAFCESGAPNSAAAGDEYLHLPAIVDAAESSPTAAKEAAATVRRYLSKDHYQRGYAQYNAIMLLRILTDNPGPGFTQNFDSKFVSTVKELLRDGKDGSVQQILRETLDYIEVDKAPGNDTLGPLVEMWRKEKGKRNTLRQSVGSGSLEAASSDRHTEHQQQHRVPPPFAGQYQHPGPRVDLLPPPEELAARIEEAKTTARLLVQTVQSTPQSELLANDLVQEFAGRAQSAQKSIQTYMNCQNPPPDPDTMLTLIETNDHLNIAMSKHQRAVLRARKANGTGTPSPGLQTDSMPNPISMPQHNLGQNVYSSGARPDSAAYSESPPERQNTFPTPVNGSRQEERYTPPPGPPPSAQGAARDPPATSSYDYAYPYTAPGTAPPLPTRLRPQSRVGVYGHSENPFADDAYGSGSPQRHEPRTSTYDRTPDTPSTEPQRGAGHQYPSELSSGQEISNPYESAQGYIQKPDSPAAYDPSSQIHHGRQPSDAYGSDTLSPVDDTGRRMNDMHI